MKRWIVVAAACGLWSCGKSGPAEPRFEKPPAAPSEPAASESAKVDAGSVAQGNPHNVVIKPDVRPGWEHEELDDRVPLCIFGSFEEREHTPFLEQVRPQQLKAGTGTQVVFGAFAPRCLHRDCDDSPTLQAWIDEGGDGKTFVVHTKYTGEHKTGSSCDKCEVVIASAETGELAPGTYTVKYGALTQQFEVPGTLKQPCLGLKLKPPPAPKKGAPKK